MANVGSLTVTLTALTGRFSKGMRKAAGEVGAFATSVGAASAKLATMSTAAAAVAGGAIALLTHRQAEMIDNTAKVADRLGESTEALLGMRHAADLAGVGAEEFDKAMEKLSKNLGNPTQDVGEALEKVGLSAAGLLRMSPAQRFSAIADGINKLGSQSEKAAVATALFGKTGANLLNTLDLGSKGLAEAAAEATKLGMAFSRVDAAQVEAANDAITKLHGAFDAVFTKLAIQFAPFITDLTDKLIGLGTNGTSVADSIANGAIDMVRSMLRVVDVVELADSAFEGLKGTALSVAGAWSKLQYIVSKSVGDAVNFHAKLATGGMSGDLIDTSGLDALLDTAAERDAKAVEAFAKSREKLAAAIEGGRSSSARAAFDAIRAGAASKAAQAVKDQAASRATAHAAEVKAAREGFAAMMKKLSTGAGGFGSNLLTAGNGARLVDDVMGKIAGFFRSLPERAVKAGYMPTMDLHTSARGTFSGETAGRQSSVLNIQTKQLEISRQQLEQLAAIRGSLAGGIAIP